jgi:hypothetical protein
MPHPPPRQGNVPPPDRVYDVMLWRLATRVAAAHRPHPGGGDRCASPLCAGQRYPCPPAILAARAIHVAITTPPPAYTIRGRATLATPHTHDSPGRPRTSLPHHTAPDRHPARPPHRTAVHDHDQQPTLRSPDQAMSRDPAIGPDPTTQQRSVPCCLPPPLAIRQ